METEKLTENIKDALRKIGEKAGFICKNEYSIKLKSNSKEIARIDHVWMIEEPIRKEKIPFITFEININPNSINMKKIKGDIMNLRLAGAAKGFLILPFERAEKEYEKPPWAKDRNSLEKVIFEMGKSFRVESLDMDVVLFRAEKI